MAKLNARDEARRGERVPGLASPGDYSEALERGIRILGAFGPDSEQLTQSELARRLELPRATVRRALLTLEHLGFVLLEGRSYRLTPKVLTLATAYLTANPVSRVLQPACEQLSTRFNASCTVAVLDGPAAVMIARALPRSSLQMGQGIGFRVPAVRSALGRVLLSALDDETLRSYLDEQQSQGDPAPEETIAGLMDVREQGHAYVANEVEAGFHSVAVPLRRWDDKAVAALNVGAALEQSPRSFMLDEVLPALLDTAVELRPRLI